MPWRFCTQTCAHQHEARKFLLIPKRFLHDRPLRVFTTPVVRIYIEHLNKSRNTFTWQRFKTILFFGCLITPHVVFFSKVKRFLGLFNMFLGKRDPTRRLTFDTHTQSQMPYTKIHLKRDPKKAGLKKCCFPFFLSLAFRQELCGRFTTRHAQSVNTIKH